MGSSRFMGVIAAGACMALATTGIAGDKSQSNLVNPVVLTGASPTVLTPPISAAWTNGVSKGKTKGGDNCKVQIQLQKLTLPDSDGVAGTGDEVICVADANVSAGYALPLSTSVVFRGEVAGGTVKIKADLAAEGTGCVPAKKGGLGVAQYEGRVTCYEPSPYPPPPAPFLSDPTQGLYPASFAPRPPGGLIATQGINIAP
jgi:hypothetical protein